MGQLVRRVVLLLVAVVAVLGLVDGGSVYLTKVELPDNVKSAGYAAADATRGGPVNRQAAVTGWKAAEDNAQQHGFDVRAKSFTLYPDGRVQLTGTKHAPTLLLRRVPALASLARVTSTQTVSALPYSSSPRLTWRTR